MDRRRFTGLSAVAALSLLSGGCASGNNLSRKPQTDRELKGMGFVVVVENYKRPLVPPDGLKDVRVIGISDAGNFIISKSFSGAGGGNSMYLPGTNMSFPRWVKVYYRAPAKPEDVGVKIDSLTGKKIDMLSNGDIFAEYKIEVLSRIPEEVFAFTYAPHDPRLLRIIRVKFRIKEDGVLFGWDVEQMDFRTPNGGIKYAMMGGDFLDNVGGRPFKPNQLIDMTKE